MALSQLQCLDDNHVNWRLNESKPEFYYSEEQRLAVEALLSSGPDAFQEVIKKHNIRDFLSEPELERICKVVEIYQPGSENVKGDHESGDEESQAVSLQYWPDNSDISIPKLDRGWPDSASYRGVTRANVYTQPPMEGQTHIKEIVRKIIVQAQKVIAVVMDLFTDVDIFKDMLDAGFKKKVAVYIILEETNVHHFLHMCQKAGMHAGHLKNLRVRSIGGTEFYTRSSLKIRGLMSQKFMFVDGDRAVSGSYSFTWTASRMDRNLITVLTGQAVDTFDKQFRDLYLNSKEVNLNTIKLLEEPEPQPVPQAAPPPVQSAEVARKMINPKYTILMAGNQETASKTSSGKNSDKAKAVPGPVEVKQELPSVHPGLLYLERAYMINYVPTWPEPDPPSDVIGFINIRDSKKPNQAHLMRSELFKTSQAIRFKEPFTPAQHPDTQDQPAPQKTEKAAKDSAKVPEPGSSAKVKKNDVVRAPKTEHKPLANEQPKKSLGKPTPPVPKPRTVHLVLNSSSTASNENLDIAEVSNKPHNSARPKTEEQQESETELDVAVCTVDSIEAHTEEEEGEVEESSGDDINSSEFVNDESSTSSASEECFEYNDSDSGLQGTKHEHILNGVSHHDPEATHRMARFSQSLVDLRPESQKKLDDNQERTSKALEDIKGLEKRQKLPVNDRLYYGRKQKQMYQTSSRSPASTIQSDGENQTHRLARGPIKVVIAKPGSHHRTTKTSAPVIGGHKYRQDKANSLSHVKSNSGHSSPNRLTRDKVSVDNSMTPFGVSCSKLSQIKHLRNKIPQKRMPLDP
ncbi:protein FAM83G-like isoform X1 [Acipenser ruthenus]|uniref:protein FAM83G-like isoform X1 n=1 Tax=Acipenser ruthenus TaxID=7906 RepID=UPI002741D486|nr:protein FAM83G-like isoform X1 [Acipenser ruthenus]